MSYQRGTEAYNYSGNTAPRRRERISQETQPSFDVVQGGGLDASARKGVSRTFVVRMRNAVIAAVVVVALGLCRVGITVATVTTLESSSDLRDEIDALETENDELSVECSILSDSSRITRIATQNLGMVLADERVSVTIELDSDETETDVDTEAADGEDVASSEETSLADDVS